MNSKFKLCAVVAAICVLGILSIGTLGWAETGVIRIGAHLPLSGPTAPTGALNKQGSDLAIDIINNKYTGLTLPLAGTEGIPNLDGAKIEVIYADDRGDPNVALAEVERLIQQEKVVAILGGWQSSCIKTGSMVAERLKTPYISGAGSSVDLTKRGLKYYFRLIAHSGKVAKAYFDCLQDMEKRLGKKYETVAVAYENTEYGSVCNEQIEEQAGNRGYKIVASIPFDSTATSVKLEVQKIKAAKPDAFFQIGYDPDAILFTKTMKTFKYTPPVWFGMAGYTSPKYIPSVGTDGNGILISGWFHPGYSKPVTQEVGKIYKERYGQAMTIPPALTFMPPFVIADAINRAGSTDKDAIRDAMEKTKFGPEQNMMPGPGIWFTPVQAPPKHSHDNEGATMLVLQIIDKKYEVVWPFDGKTAEIVWPHPKWNEK
jgi:branched-chain amino acid transport system substrate-binding protein